MSNKINVRLMVFILLSIFIIVGESNAQTVVDDPISDILLSGTASDLAWNEDSSVVAVATVDGVLIFDIGLNQLDHILANQPVNSVAWSPDGDQLAVAYANIVQIWSWNSVTASLTNLTTIQDTREQALVRWSPDGNKIALLRVLPDFPSGPSLSVLQVLDTSNWQVITESAQQFTVDLSFSLSNILDWNDNSTQIVIVGNSLPYTF